MLLWKSFAMFKKCQTTLEKNPVLPLRPALVKSKGLAAKTRCRLQDSLFPLLISPLPLFLARKRKERKKERKKEALHFLYSSRSQYFSSASRSLFSDLFCPWLLLFSSVAKRFMGNSTFFGLEKKRQADPPRESDTKLSWVLERA